MDRLKDKHAADLTVAGNIQGSAPFVARTPRPQRSAIPNLRGLSASLGSLLDKRQKSEEELEKIRSGAEAKEFFTKFGDSAKERKVLGEMISASNPIKREQWQRASANNYVRQYAQRFEAALEEEAKEVAANPGAGGLMERSKNLGQRILSEMEEEVGDLFRGSAYQRDLFYGQVNQLLGGKGELGGLEAKALQVFSRAEEQAGDIAIAGSLSDQLVISAHNTRDPSNPGTSATELLKGDREALQANYDDLARGRTPQEAAALTESAALTAIDRLQTEMDDKGRPVYDPDDLANLLESFASVKVTVPSEGPGRPKKVPLLDRSDALRGKLQDLQRATRGTGSQSERVAREAFDDNFAAIEKEVDALASIGRRDVDSLEKSVEFLVGSMNLDGNDEARAERLVRTQLIAMRNERLGEIDLSRDARTKTFEDQILLTTDPATLQDLRERAVDADADPIRIQAAINNQLTVQRAALKEPDLGIARGNMNETLKLLSSPSEARTSEDILFAQQAKMRFQRLVEEVVSIEDPLERAKAVREFRDSEGYQGILGEIQERAEGYNTARKDARLNLDNLVNSGQEAAAWKQGAAALAANLITEGELEKIRKSAAKVKDPENYKTAGTRSSMANLLQLLQAEGQSDASRQKLTSGLLKSGTNILGLPSEATADPVKYTNIVTRLTEGLEARRQEIVQEVLVNPEIRGHVGKIAEVERLFRAEVEKVREGAGYGPGTYTPVDNDTMEDLLAKVKDIRGDVVVDDDFRVEISGHLKRLGERPDRTLMEPELPPQYRGKVSAGVAVDEDFMADRLRDIASDKNAASVDEAGNVLQGVGDTGIAPRIAGVLYGLDGKLPARLADGFLQDLSRGHSAVAARAFADLSRGAGTMEEKSRLLAIGQITHHMGVPAEVYLNGGRVGPFGVFSTSPRSYLEVEDAVDGLDSQIKTAAREAGMKWHNGSYYGGTPEGRAKVRELELEREYTRYDSEDLFRSVEEIPIDPWDTPFYTKANIEAAYKDPEVRRQWRQKLKVDERAMVQWWKTQKELAR